MKDENIGKLLLNENLRNIVPVGDRRPHTAPIAYLGWASVPKGSCGFVPCVPGLLQCQLSLLGSSLDWDLLFKPWWACWAQQPVHFKYPVLALMEQQKEASVEERKETPTAESVRAAIIWDRRNRISSKEKAKIWSHWGWKWGTFNEGIKRHLRRAKWSQNQLSKEKMLCRIIRKKSDS